jgi:hypothetical protein
MVGLEHADLQKELDLYVINLDPSQNPNPDDSTLLVASFVVKTIHRRIGCPAPFLRCRLEAASSAPGSDVFLSMATKRFVQSGACWR